MPQLKACFDKLGPMKSSHGLGLQKLRVQNKSMKFERFGVKELGDSETYLPQMCSLCVVVHISTLRQH